MKLEKIDKGMEFDWGKASLDYAKYRDIYPQSMYQKLNELGVGRKDEKCLDIGTGTGVLPRNMYKYGAHFIGMDISENQIAMAKSLSNCMDIKYISGNAETLPFKDESLSSVSAVQCWRYFDKDKLIPELHRVLKSNGVLAIAFMQWLPEECPITDLSLKLVKKFNPQWNPFNTRIPIDDNALILKGFCKYEYISYDEEIPFTYETWNGRMKASRGVEASLSPEKVEEFSKEHLEMLKSMTDDNFTIKHQIVIFSFNKK